MRTAPLIAMLVCAANAAALAQSPPTVWRITLPHDWDCAALADDLTDELNAARRSHAAWVVLEIEGNAARLDVTHRVITHLRAADPPTVAWIVGGDDRRVGVGQLLAAQFSSRVLLAPNVRARGRARGEFDRFSPNPDLDELLKQETLDWLGPIASDRGVPAWVPAFLFDPTTPLELRDGVLSPAPDASPASPVRLTRSEGGVESLSLDPERITGLKLAEPAPRDWRGVLVLLGTPAGETHHARLTRTLDSSRREAELLISRAEEAFTAADRALDLPAPETRRAASGAYREAAAKARPHLARLADSARTLDRLLERVPELLRTTPPGKAPPDDPDKFTQKWRSLARIPKDRLERLEEKAERFSRQ